LVKSKHTTGRQYRVSVRCKLSAGSNISREFSNASAHWNKSVEAEKCSKRGIYGKRKKAGWNENYLLKVLQF
jgi:hypothetical protein